MNELKGFIGDCRRKPLYFCQYRRSRKAGNKCRAFSEWKMAWQFGNVKRRWQCVELEKVTQARKRVSLWWFAIPNQEAAGMVRGSNGRLFSTLHELWSFGTELQTTCKEPIVENTVAGTHACMVIVNKDIHILKAENQLRFPLSVDIYRLRTKCCLSDERKKAHRDTGTLKNAAVNHKRRLFWTTLVRYLWEPRSNRKQQKGGNMGSGGFTRNAVLNKGRRIGWEEILFERPMDSFFSLLRPLWNALEAGCAGILRRASCFQP